MNISYFIWKTPNPPSKTKQIFLDEKYRYLITILNVTFCWIVALVFKEMDVVLGIAGSLGAAVLIMTAPGLM